MTTSELEAWTFRPAFNDSWLSEAFARDNESLTRALQKSLSTESESLIDSNNSSSPFLIVKPEPAHTSSVSDPDSVPRRRNGVSNGKITKRKSRASKRSPTTFIKADPANFRQMVQQVTGIRFSESHVPVVQVLKPEPQRPGNRIQNCFLPTLDTSAFLLDDNIQQQQQQQQQSGLGNQRHQSDGHDHVSYAPVTDGGAGLDYGSVHNFPTLESWKVM